MGMLTDLVVCDVADAAKLCANSRLYRDYPNVSTSGLTSTMLSSLADVLPKRAKRKKVEIPLTYSTDSDGGPWIFRVPEELVERITEMNDSELAEIASRWIDNDDDLSLLDPSEKQVIELLSKIRMLAKKSFENQKSLFLLQRI